MRRAWSIALLLLAASAGLMCVGAVRHHDGGTAIWLWGILAVFLALASGVVWTERDQ